MSITWLEYLELGTLACFVWRVGRMLTWNAFLKCLHCRAELPQWMHVLFGYPQSNLRPTTCIAKAVVCAVLSVGVVHIKYSLLLMEICSNSVEIDKYSGFLEDNEYKITKGRVSNFSFCRLCYICESSLHFDFLHLKLCTQCIWYQSRGSLQM